MIKAHKEALSRAKRELEKAQERLKKRYDEGRREEIFEPGDYVYLKLQYYRQRTIRGRRNMKLSQRFYVSFRILERIGEFAYRLELPPTTLLHLVFHVSQNSKKSGTSGTRTS